MVNQGCRWEVRLCAHGLKEYALLLRVCLLESERVNTSDGVKGFDDYGEVRLLRW